MTAQEIFDTVWHAMKAQGKRSVKVGEAGDRLCVYRGPDGLKCAAGHLISDEEYNEKMEAYGVYTLGDLGLFPRRLQEHLTLIGSLQTAHDSASDSPDYFWESFSRKARGIARDRNLTIPENTQ